MNTPGSATKVLTRAIVGQGVAYLLAVILARRLGVEGFKAYVVASALFIVMVTLAPRGFDKYALRLLPVLLDTADWGRARGYLGFGARRTLWSSLCIAFVTAISACFARGLHADTRFAIIVSCVSLPAGALVHFALEVLTALGRGVAATTIFRVVVPLVVLVSVGILSALSVPVSGAIAVGCWGVAWAVALAVMIMAIRRSAPPQTLQARSIEEASAWEIDARPFWIYRISLAVLGQAGVIVLDWLQPSASVVGAYAAAMGIASVAQVLATATNRVYAGQLSVLLEQRDFGTILRLRRKRLIWIAIPIAAYLGGTFGFTRELLAFFRPEFVEEGVVALRLLALTTAFIVLVALAPTWLKFRARNQAIYVTVASAAFTQIALLLLLVPRMGATGAAAAYAIAMCGMYGNFARLARRELTLMKRRALPQTS
jgi:O-antigen/teichoic acid export membrane protein